MHHQRAPASRLGERYEAGRRTRGAIVRAAGAVLTRDGYAQFSVRRVAAELGIAPGNVNYYFPTKASLLETLVSYTLAQYREQARAVLPRTHLAITDFLGGVLRRLMEDARSDQSSRLFRELWAVALHHPQIAKAMDSFYSRSAKAYLRLARRTSETAPGGAELEGILYLMLVISEGVSVLFGTRPADDDLFGRVSDAAHRAIVHLLLRSGE